MEIQLRRGMQPKTGTLKLGRLATIDDLCDVPLTFGKLHPEAGFPADDA
jgi:hypothetical protein